MNTQSPFQEFQHHATAVVRALDDLQAYALRRLPGVPWDFGTLRSHLSRMADLVGMQMPLKAWNEHRRFSVMPKGALLGSTKSLRKTKANRQNGALGGRSQSPAKIAAARANGRSAAAKRATAARRAAATRPLAVTGSDASGAGSSSREAEASASHRCEPPQARSEPAAPDSSTGARCS